MLLLLVSMLLLVLFSSGFSSWVFFSGDVKFNVDVLDKSAMSL